MVDVPVYLFLGFLESGKTSFVLDTLSDEDFATGEPTLLIVCEEGEIEYEEEFLKENNVTKIEAAEMEQLTTSFLRECKVSYRPKRVLIEYNGMWDMEYLLSLEFPRRWQLAQVITNVDASTFDTYLNNMRSILIPQLANSDMVIFNRCNENTKKAALRRTVLSVNKRAQMYFEAAEGVVLGEEEESLPFDIQAEVIDLHEDDFGLWYIDAMEKPQKYAGKKVHFKGIVYKSKDLPRGQFVPGRFAMTCCADDVGFIGFPAKADPAELAKYKVRDWVSVTARMDCIYQEDFEGEAPILEILEMEPAEAIEDDLVYFN